MADPIENKLIDKRVAHRYVRKGLVDEKDYEKYLKSLPDLADQALSVEAAMDDDDLDDLDDELDDEPVDEVPGPEAGAGGTGTSQP
jgi:hypothetical protein